MSISLAILGSLMLIGIIVTLYLFGKRRIVNVLVNVQSEQARLISSIREEMIFKLESTRHSVNNRFFVSYELRDLGSLPQQDDWQIPWELTYLLIRTIKEMQPVRVIEFGSGYSTLIMAHALTRSDLHSSIVTIENDLNYMNATKELLLKNDIKNVNLVHSPLIESKKMWWYDIPSEILGQKFDLILIDGPHNERKNGIDFFREIAHEDSVFVIDDYFSKESSGLSEISKFFSTFEVQTFGIEREFGVVTSRKKMEILKRWNLNSNAPSTN